MQAQLTVYYTRTPTNVPDMQCHSVDSIPDSGQSAERRHPLLTDVLPVCPHGGFLKGVVRVLSWV